MTTDSTGNLAAALSAAVQSLTHVAPDKRNTFHKYDYASAEAMLASSRAALSDNALALVPTSAKVEKLCDEESQTSKGEAHTTTVYVMRRTMRLVHDSGESIELGTDWPFQVEKGKTLDKAMAAAETGSLKYLLRTLLLIPRVDAHEEMDAGPDGGYQSRPKPRGISTPVASKDAADQYGIKQTKAAAVALREAASDKAAFDAGVKERIAALKPKPKAKSFSELLHENPKQARQLVDALQQEKQEQEAA